MGMHKIYLPYVLLFKKFSRILVTSTAEPELLMKAIEKYLPNQNTASA